MQLICSHSATDYWLWENQCPKAVLSFLCVAVFGTNRVEVFSVCCC